MTDSANSMSPSPKHDSSYIPGIEGLRGISVLAVLFYHLNARLVPGGFVGVDIFFVISGFVVAMATSSIAAKDFWVLALAFYRRRFVRILPASLVFLLITQILAVLFIPTVNRLVDGDRTGLAAAFGASNFVLWWWSADYFSAGPELNPFTHTWSLAVEEQFYLTFPPLAWLTWSARAGMRKLGLSMLGLLAAASLFAAIWLTSRYATLAFYLLPTRFWELGAGVLLFALTGRDRVLSGQLSAMLQVAGCGLLAAALLLTDPLRVPFPDSLWSVSAALCLIAVSTGSPGSLVARTLSAGWLRYFGRISYSLYLWHWGVIVLLRWTVGVESIGSQMLALLFSWAAAHGSWRYVERPLRESCRLARLGDIRIVLLGLLAMCAAAGVIGGTVLLRPAITLSSTGNRDDWLAYRQQSLGPCRVAASDSRQPVGHLSQFARASCDSAADKRHLYAIGDSHAMVYQRMFGNIALHDGVPSSIYAETGCAFLPAVRNDEGEGRCKAFREAALAEVLKQAKAGDWLFLPGLRSPRICDAVTPVCGPAAQRPYNDAQLAAEYNRLKPLLDRGVRVIFEAPKPVFPIQPMRCADWFNRGNPACSMPMPSLDWQQENRAHGLSLLKRMQGRNARIEIWDAFQVLCPQGPCGPFKDGRPLFTDTDHVSGFANDLLTGPFSQVLGLRGGSLPGR